MSEEDYKKLKEEIKRELINEMTTKQFVKDNMWKDIKKEFEKMYYSKGYDKNPERYKIFVACSTIVRIALGYSNVASIPVEKEQEVRNIMYKILNIFPNKDKEDKK